MGKICSKEILDNIEKNNSAFLKIFSECETTFTAASELTTDLLALLGQADLNQDGSIDEQDKLIAQNRIQNLLLNQLASLEQLIEIAKALNIKNTQLNRVIYIMQSIIETQDSNEQKTDLSFESKVEPIRFSMPRSYIESPHSQIFDKELNNPVKHHPDAIVSQNK